ncbi:MAG: mechanosensitive ion channel [Candidatus Omnitrophica bacterium]|nr:mechanosensitive ion channel [Candidatus Omnitrophota bacterium]
MGELSKKVVWEVIKKSFLPLIIFLLFIESYVYYKIQIAPRISTQLHQDLKKYIGTIFIICIAFIIQRIAGVILAWYKENITAKTKTQLDDKLIPLLRRVVKVIVWVMAFLIILPFYGVNISALIAVLGVGSLAIALAAQDTIANIISGFMIMLDAPFEIGDKIKLPSGETVEVLDIGVRRSKFLSEDKAIITVPNTNLSKSKIVNYTYGEKLKNAV